MSDYYDSPGYEDCVMNSSDDYEPYGYMPAEQCQQAQEAQAVRQTQLRLAEFTPERRNPAFDRVIEAQILAQSSMVGC
jgi:hypothetical protein